ncbi:hypothetical protein [Aquimarina sp. AU119]|uniref:hypothetical protein n=1 Tax=Aquimarina sp. AU119 TaxID=2108528 RepID=UPI000D69C25F|nr:hypothetical protein [Aquimarina sp. AU119]
MAKKNLPNIPIYIGDWERDCNVLSLESEMAWMKIIFKMHLNGKQSSYKTSTKGLQILWKSQGEKVKEIIEELLFNEICEISEITGGFIFKCRRLEKENKISKTRSEAVSKRYKNKKEDTSHLQTSYKNLQNTDIDYENESDNEIKNKIEIEKGVVGEIFEHEFTEILSDFFLQTTEAQKMKVNGFLRSKLIRPQIENFKLQTQAYAEYKELTGEKIHNWFSYQAEWDREDWIKKLEREKLNNQRKDVKKNNQNSTGASDEFRTKTAERLGIIQSK